MYIHSSEHNKDRGTIKWTLPHLKSDFHYMQAIKKLSGLWWWNHFLTEYWCRVISSAHAFTYRGFQLHILPVHSITLMLKLCQSYVGKSGSLADTYQVIRDFVGLACSWFCSGLEEMQAFQPRIPGTRKLCAQHAWWSTNHSCNAVQQSRQDVGCQNSVFCCCFAAAEAYHTRNAV